MINNEQFMKNVTALWPVARKIFIKVSFTSEEYRRNTKITKKYLNETALTEHKYLDKSICPSEIHYSSSNSKT